MYAIRNKKTGKWLYGTDWRYNPPHQRTSAERIQTWDTSEEAKSQFRWRRCGKKYEVVPVRVEAIE